MVADDLTGALDASAAFAAGGLTATVSVSARPRPMTPTEAEVICLDTQTRNSSEPVAVREVRRATRQLLDRGCRRLYKKVDSTLRGHVGVEIKAMLRESGASLALVCPAFPSMGRTVRDGLLYVGEMPVTRSAEGRDPFGAVADASLLDLLERQAGDRPGLVPLREVRRGCRAAGEVVASLESRGHSLIVLDAASHPDLEAIATIAGAFPEALLVGSAGLAYAVATGLPGRRREDSTASAPPVADGPFLLVSGSLNPVTAGQIAHAHDVAGLRVFSVDSSRILGTRAEADLERRRVEDEAVTALRGGEDAAVVLAGGAASQGPIPAHASGRLGTAIREIVRAVAAGADLSGLVLVGGDTAYSALSGLEAETVAVHGEVEPGVPLGTIRGGLAGGKLLVTKAGGFGSTQTLSRVVEYFRSSRPGD